ncbi:MAG: tRNA (guanosine(46)-N7)-methyltransferase TrmB [Prevotella sp.]|jgi:tRNA (guanine-N7-)-methyltransferase|nr:tRNA (guanosine(46)-N7)-methyltransferase TrmB [Prevotella sp.]
MGKNKLAKFADMEEYPHVFQYPYAVLQERGFGMKGKWNGSFFKNDNPTVLELGCGKGEYTVGLAKLFPDKNFIGIDIKGARMWTGAKQSLEEKLPNVAFLRTHIELITGFFAKGEIAEIWITFPDPQMNRVNKRLTSTRFMKLYRRILSGNGVIHLKTDSNFMYAYTCEMAKVNSLPVLFRSDDLYHSGLEDNILNIQTFYEQQWLSRGLNIKYIKFECPDKDNWVEPDAKIEKDPYRSYGRGNILNQSTENGEYIS